MDTRLASAIPRPPINSFARIGLSSNALAWARKRRPLGPARFRCFESMWRAPSKMVLLTLMQKLWTISLLPYARMPTKPQIRCADAIVRVTLGRPRSSAISSQN